MATAAQLQVKPGKLFIGGKWVDAASGKTFPTVNPATGETITVVAEGDERDASAAVEAAFTAFHSGPWPEMSASDRGRILWKIGDLVDKYNEELGTLETLYNGKPIFESRQVDMPMVAEVFRYYAGWATKIHGETRTGQEILRDSADTLKRVTLELGGKSPNIVFADADLDAAVRGATIGIFYGKGEV